MAASSTPTSSTETMPVATALSDGLLTMLTPMVDKVDNGIQQAAESQVALSRQIDRVAAELQAFLGASAIPSFSPYAQRLAEVRRRTAAASSTLQQVQARLRPAPRRAMAALVLVLVVPGVATEMGAGPAKTRRRSSKSRSWLR